MKCKKSRSVVLFDGLPQKVSFLYQDSGGDNRRYYDEILYQALLGVLTQDTAHLTHLREQESEVYGPLLALIRPSRSIKKMVLYQSVPSNDEAVLEEIIDGSDQSWLGRIMGNGATCLDKYLWRTIQSRRYGVRLYPPNVVDHTDIRAFVEAFMVQLSVSLSDTGNGHASVRCSEFREGNLMLFANRFGSWGTGIVQYGCRTGWWGATPGSSAHEQAYHIILR